MYESRVFTARKISQAIQKSQQDNRPEVFVQITGVGYYPDNTPSKQTEDSPGGKNNFFATLVKDWEEAAKVRNLHNNMLINVMNNYET